LWEAPEQYGGAGVKDYRYSVALAEEYYRTGTTGFGLAMQNDVMPPYLLELTNDEQKARWLPGSVSGDIVWAIAMSEPADGPDQDIRSRTVAAGSSSSVIWAAACKCLRQ
jgi:alkylation response protein AidB-like acyl-CoA dehydrogenase